MLQSSTRPHPLRALPSLLAIGLGVAVALAGATGPAMADCSVIAPEGFDQRGFLGSLTSPFLTPGLTNDVKIVGAICEQAERSTAADFRIDGVDVGADDFVVTIAFTSDPAGSLLVLASDASLCGSDPACSVDTVSEREIAEVPLPGGGVERRLRFRVPEDLAHFGPTRLAVRRADGAAPVATELRSARCLEASGSFVACVDEFYLLDGSCRVGESFASRPFSGLVALPKTDFSDLCTEGCETPGTTSQLPITTDREGNAVFAMIYADQLVRADRGDGRIEPRPRRLSLAIDEAAANGFTDDAPVVYESKPSSYTFEGFPLSPPFNPFVDPTTPVGQIGIWGMADAEATVHFVPRRSCATEPARACSADAECPDGGSCRAPEFDFAQDGAAVQLPLASAVAGQAFELNSWLDGGLSDNAVAVAEDERLGGEPLNRDGAADDIVVELLDRATGLLRRLGDLVGARGLAQVRVAEGDEDFVIPSVAAEDRRLAFLELEFAEGLASPLAGTSQAEALAADLNGNARLDQNLRVFTLSEDPAAEAAIDLLAPGLQIPVLTDGRFDDRQNLVLSDGRLYFAYAPIRLEPHAYQLVNQASDGTPGNSFAGDAELSSDGRFLAFTSGADNLFVPAFPGELSAITSGGTLLEAVVGAGGEFPIRTGGQTIFEYVATDNAKGPAPSHTYVELPLCDTAAGEPDLLALVDLAATGPNAEVVEVPNSCADCGFPGALTVEYDRGLGKGGSQTYRLVLDDPDVPAGEIGVNFKSGGQIESLAIRGPACIDPRLTPGIERVYLRDLEAGTTEIVSVGDRASCAEAPAPTDSPSENPDVTIGGQLVFFDSAASLTDDDVDDERDVFAYDPETCRVVNVSEGVSGPAADPSSSDDGALVVFEVGADPSLLLVDRVGGTQQGLGPGRDPSLSADGTKLVYTADVAGFSQVFLVEIENGVAGPPVVVSVIDDEPAPLGAGGGSVASSGRTVFETPPGDSDSDLFVRDVTAGTTLPGSSLPTGEAVCTGSPCGAFEATISDDGLFLAYVLRGLAPFDEVVLKDLTTGAITPVSRMAGADADSFAPSLGASGDFLALSSFASQLGGVAGAGAPNVFLEGPLDPNAQADARVGVLDLSSCEAGGCVPTLTDEPVLRGDSYAGDLAVVGSPVRILGRGSQGGLSVRTYDREGSAVALAGSWVCAIARTDASGRSGRFAACGSRAGTTLVDLTFAGAPIEAQEVGLCGDRAIVLGSDGSLYEADLSVGPEAVAIQAAVDFELGSELDTDADGSADSCLVAFRSAEDSLGGGAAEVGNRDLDLDDLAMYVLDVDGSVTDCFSSATDCPGQACRQFNYQVGKQAVVFLVDEADENFGFDPSQDICAPGTDVNEDGLCDISVRRCTAAGSLTEGTSFGRAANVFAAGRFPDGENTVTEAGFCGTDPANVRFGQLCIDDLDCLALPGETCQQGFVILSALADTDGDEIPDVFDNCPTVPNPDQANSDALDPALASDPFGDACDAFTCGDGLLQTAETCDEGTENGAPGGSCSASCGCTVQFTVIETLKPGSNGNTPIVVFGSAAPDGSGCVNLSNSEVGGVAPRTIDPTSLRLSASPPSEACPTAGGAPIHDLSRRYNSHLEDNDGDGLTDLRVHVDTAPIGGDASTTVVYLTGRFSDASNDPGACFVATAPVQVSGN